MASKYLNLFKIAPEFEDILNDFNKEILWNKPSECYWGKWESSNPEQ